MLSPEEMFRHAYKDGLQALELSRANNEVELKTLQASPDAAPSRIILREECGKMIRSMLEKLTLESPDPESVIRQGVIALQQVEELRFLSKSWYRHVIYLFSSLF